MTIEDAFYGLYNLFKSALCQSHDLRQWCRIYCSEHWHDDEYFNWYKIVTVSDLLYELKYSSYHNPINIGLLKFLADKSKDMSLINAVINYELKFSCMKIADLDFISCIEVQGNISRRESTLIVSTLWENRVTVGQLWNFDCVPRVVEREDFDS